MNCKPGDLAIVVGARYSQELVGAVCQVIKLVPCGFEINGTWNHITHRATGDAVWLVEYANRGRGLHSDSRLRPIRDNDGEDEMLRIVGKPEPVSA